MHTCDRCGPYVAAKVSVLTPTGALTFCGHCARKYGKGLAKYPMTPLDGNVHGVIEREAA